MNKKAQSQIITTVLIILLVLAAIVIVWQVVQSTVTRGGEEIEAQSVCLGISATLAEDATMGYIVLTPTKDISGYRIYTDDIMGAISTTDSDAYISVPTTENPSAGQKVTCVLLVGTEENPCPCMVEYTATSPESG